MNRRRRDVGRKYRRNGNGETGRGVRCSHVILSHDQIDLNVFESV